MKRDWRPGDVAVFTTMAGDELVVFRHRDIDAGTDEWTSATEGGAYPLAHSLRPLVVIDPEDREAVERLVRIWGGGTDDVPEFQAALREFADPKPPKPEEPMGKWAIVTAFGVTYCRAAWADSKPWSRVGTDHFASWDELDVDSVEFEGVR